MSSFLANTEHDFFILALVLILVVYFVGVSTEAKTLGGVASSLGLIFTGRNASGAFAGYPGVSSAALSSGGKAYTAGTLGLAA